MRRGSNSRAVNGMDPATAKRSNRFGVSWSANVKRLVRRFAQDRLLTPFPSHATRPASPESAASAQASGRCPVGSGASGSYAL